MRALARDGWTVAATGYRAYDETETWGSEPEAPAALLGEGALTAWHEHDLAERAAPPRVFDLAEEAVGPLTALVDVQRSLRPRRRTGHVGR